MRRTNPLASSALLDDIAPARSLGRAYTVMVAVGLIGVILGTALDARPVLLIGAGVLAVVASWTTRRVRSLVLTTRDAPVMSCASGALNPAMSGRPVA